jgi:hypothetical protein
MKMKDVLKVGLIVGLSMVVVGVARSGSEKIKGEGTLRAQGVGRAGFKGSGVIDVTLEPAANGKGAGRLVVSKNAQVTITGEGRKREEGKRVIYEGFSGKAHVEGNRIGALVAGGKITLVAKGRGVAHLQGRGHYEVDGKKGEWTEQGVKVPVGDVRDEGKGKNK